ncbi:diuretic hormone receptor-like [Uloborus diversus]|uniref:diuretic hormone receptor-like n=1 Tax=Uloborus diversus TaxID=327109 RepID=UPI002409F403|nr:diuretic hormone receptor-like [Uloborus diversus]
MWAGVKGQLDSSTEDPLAPQGCPWQRRDFYDYIFISPVIFILMVNIAFLMKIMWVLITKLRATKTLESEQYRKAAKALLVLIPLLGVTYILVIATPTHRMGEVIFTFIQAILLSIQGFIVAVLYCFLNGEVQNSVRHRLERWKIHRAVGRGHHQPLNSQASSQGEKFYRNRGIRNSSISFATSTSLINFQSVRTPSVNKLDSCTPLQATESTKDDAV